MSEAAQLRVLVVEPDPPSGHLLCEQLRALGLEGVLQAETGRALDLARRESFTLALVGERLGESSGLRFLEVLADVQPSMARAVVSGGRDPVAVREAVRSGLLLGCLDRPWTEEDLLRVVRAASDWQSSCTRPVSADPCPGSRPVLPEPGLDAAVNLSVRLLQAYHPNLGNASLRVAALSRSVAEVAGVPPHELTAFLQAAALHDVGLVSVDRGIVRRWLRDPSKCTEEELSMLRAHPVATEAILGTVPALAGAARLCRHHHESFDGSGYPDGLKGEMIPRLARLLSPVIHFCHRLGPARSVLADMEAWVGRTFDPSAFQVLVEALPRASLPRGEREVPLAELKAGMVLGGDILNASGHPLLPRGRELRESDIHRVSAIHRVTPLAPYVLVFC